MTFYEYLKNGEEYCEEQARSFSRDLDMRIFWTKSADGCRARIGQLTLEKAAQEWEEAR